MGKWIVWLCVTPLSLGIGNYGEIICVSVPQPTPLQIVNYGDITGLTPHLRELWIMMKWWIMVKSGELWGNDGWWKWGITRTRRLSSHHWEWWIMLKYVELRENELSCYLWAWWNMMKYVELWGNTRLNSHPWEWWMMLKYVNYWESLSNYKSPKIWAMMYQYYCKKFCMKSKFAKTVQITLYKRGLPNMKEIKLTFPRWLLCEITCVRTFYWINYDFLGTTFRFAFISCPPPPHTSWKKSNPFFQGDFFQKIMLWYNSAVWKVTLLNTVHQGVSPSWIKWNPAFHNE